MGRQILEQAVTQAGSPERAAARLGISESLLQRFRSGSLAVPDQLLLKAVDLVSEGMVIEPPAPSPDRAPSQRNS